MKQLEDTHTGELPELGTPRLCASVDAAFVLQGRSKLGRANARWYVLATGRDVDEAEAAFDWYCSHSNLEVRIRPAEVVQSTLFDETEASIVAALSLGSSASAQLVRNLAALRALSAGARA